jgi:hypothetical protein
MFDLNLRQKRKLKFSGFIFTLPSLENHAIILQMEKLKHETDQSKKVLNMKSIGLKPRISIISIGCLKCL